MITQDLGIATAYGYAKSKGYTGTEAEFAELMASYASVAQSAAASATAAAGSATSAASSANTASTAASTATTKASEASTSATNASGSASSAASSASAASGSATSAAASATTASGKASEATTAATTATTAKTDAVAAKTAAETAKTAAETAQGLAEDAQAAAEEAAASVTASAAQIEQNAEDITAINEALTTKANADGSYDTLTAGSAKQLLSNLEQTDMVPYNYRTAGGSLEIGDREKLKKIVGGSLAVNQLFDKPASGTSTVAGGVTRTISSDGTTITLVGTATSADFGVLSKSFIVQQGHKYFFSNVFTGTDMGNGNIWQVYLAGGVQTTYTVKNRILNGERNELCNWRTVIYSGAELNVKMRSPQVFDLTQMFGSTIADYIYSLETATAGAGVAWLKSHFPRIFNAGYVPYNAGELVSVQASAHKMVGFNQWDEEWESGSIDANSGENVSEGTYWRTKNYIPVLPNTAYYVSCQSSTNVQALRGRMYDANKNYLGYTPKAGTFATNVGFTTPENVYYMRFAPATGAIPNHDICINLHWDGERDGEYEAYEEHSYPLDSDVTLRGIPKLDANNNLYYDGDEYEADGTVTHYWKEVTYDGGEKWAKDANISGYCRFYVRDDSVKTMNDYRGQIINSMGYGTANGYGIAYNPTDNVLVTAYTVIGSANYIYIALKESMNISTVDAFKAWLAQTPVSVLLPLATPTTESADPYTEIQNVSNWGTEEFVTTSLVPVGHETAYQPDLRAKIEVAPESPDTDGLYLMKRENGQNSYVAYLGELPSDPTTDGTYTLKCTVASGTATKTWEADT